MKTLRDGSRAGAADNGSPSVPFNRQRGIALNGIFETYVLQSSTNLLNWLRIANIAHKHIGPLRFDAGTGAGSQFGR